MKKQNRSWILFILLCLSFPIIVNFEEDISKSDKERHPLIEPSQADVSVNISKVGTYKNFAFFRAFGIYVSEPYAYVACEMNGLVVLNVSNPSNPIKIGQFNESGNAYSVSSRHIFVSGEFAYLTDTRDGLYIINISNPTAPVEVGHFDDGGGATSLFVYGSYAYITRSDGLEIIDISNSSAPIKVGHFNESIGAMDVYVVGSYAYVVGFNHGFKIVQISDPANPLEVGYYYFPYQPRGIYVSGSYAYVSYGEKFLIFDISIPSNPVRVYYDDDYIQDIFVLDGYAYAVGIGFRLMDISKPSSSETLIWFNGIGGPQQEIYVSGSYAYIACYDDGLDILHIVIDDIPIETTIGADEKTEEETSSIAAYDVILLLNIAGVVSIVLINIINPHPPYDTN